MSTHVVTDSMKSLVSILIVDDDAMVRTIIHDYLSSFGFTRIDEAKNGRQAIKMIQYENKRYDLIISDWEMPEMDGLTFLKAVRNHPIMSQSKFLMVTSQGSQERFKITRAAKSRVDAYMVKPFRGDTLKSKIYELFGWGVDESSAA